MAQDASLADSEPVRLLALDGGGIRGVSELLILNEIMRRIQHDEGLAEIPRPCDYFDLIGGTSTGGLVALMLGRLRMTTDEALRTYNSLARAIFSKDNKKWTGQDGSFKATTLEKKVKEVVSKQNLGELMLDPSHNLRKGKAFVCAASANNMEHPQKFRTYPVRENASINCKIWEAARATTAAPTFFKRIAIGEEGHAKEEFIDGGLGCNNPVNQVLEEAINVFGNNKLVSCLISIGTGHPGTIGLTKPDAFQRVLPTKLISVLKKIATDCEKTANDLSARFKSIEKFYFRFNVAHGAEGISLEEWDKMGELTEHTKAYMADVSVSKSINEAVDMLRNSRQVGVTLGSVYGVPQICKVPKAYWNVPFARNLRFVGRQTQFDQLQHALFKKDQLPKIAITGLGGMGKTQIVLEIAYWTNEKYPECSVLWIPATNAESLQQAFMEIGQQFGMPGIRKQADAKKLVQQHLSKKSAGQWLLIVDNVDDMEIWNTELKEFLPKSPQGFVVCTTRSRKVAVAIAASNVIGVPEMDEAMAMQLLSKSLINQKLLADHQNAITLIDQLTFLPLALVQAAAYINNNGNTLSEYVSLLEKQEQNVVELLSEDFKDEGRYQEAKNPVATTWLISFQQIQQLDPLAAEYLSFMSCVASKEIPQSLLPPGPSQIKKDKAIGTLDAYSFVNRRATDKSLDVHRLVHLVTRSWLRSQKQWHIWADKALMRLVELIPLSGHDKREIWTAYLPHAIYTVGLADLCNAEGRISLLDRVGHCEQTLGQYKAAEWAYQQLLEQIEKVLGKEDPYTLRAMNNLAQALDGQGKYAEAEKMHQETLALREKVSGKEHPETLTSMNEVAVALSRQGKYAEAEKMHQETLALKEKVLGKERPSTLASMSNLAQALSYQGKYAEAEKMHQETLALREKVLGKEHPETLTSMNDVAVALSSQGKYAEAEKMHQETLALREKVSGKEHPSTLASMHNLALALSYQGKYAEAEKMHQETLALREKVSGKEHPETLTCMNNLAQALSHQGKYGEAISQMEECFQLRQEMLGPQHPHTQASLRTLSKWQTEK